MLLFSFLIGFIYLVIRDFVFQQEYHMLQSCSFISICDISNIYFSFLEKHSLLFINIFIWQMEQKMTNTTFLISGSLCKCLTCWFILKDVHIKKYFVISLKNFEKKYIISLESEIINEIRPQEFY